MQFFNSHTFWFVEGIFFCLVIIGLKIWAEDRGIPMRLWKWVLLVAWMLLLGFTLAFVGTSLGENEPVAATKGGILFGIIVVITGVVLWRLIMIGRQEGDTDTPQDA